MRHPDEQSLSILLRRLVHGAIAVVVDPLCPLGKLACICSGSETALHHIQECRAPLRALLGEVVLRPSLTDRPEVGWAEHASQALDGGNVGHTALGVQSVTLAGKVFFGFDRPVGAMTRNAVVGRTGDVAQARMEQVYLAAQGAVELGRRIALVAAHVDGYRGVAADAADIVFGIGHEETVVIRVGAVPGVGEPEVLPEQQTMAVAGFIEFAVAGLSYPVAYHIEVHLLVIPHRTVVLSASVAEVGLGETPVAAQRNHTAVVDKELQTGAHLLVGHLSYANLVVERVYLLTTLKKGKTGTVEVGLAIAHGPPEVHGLALQLGKLVGRESHLAALAGLERHLSGKVYRPYPSAQRSHHGGVAVVGDPHLGGHRGERVGGVYAAVYQRVCQAHATIGTQVDIVPDAGLTAGRRGHPVPSYRGMEGGVVGSQYAAVHVGALGGLLLDCAEVGGAFHPHLEAVARGQETAGHIEASTHEGSLYAPEVMAVEADRGFPVDTIEVEEHMAPLVLGRGVEGGGIGKVGMEKRL